jgi:signal transduction histidine kinase
MITAELLRRFAFLSPLSTEQLERIDERAPRVRFAAGQEIFRIGDPSGAMYLVLQGKVKVFRYDPDGEEVGLAVLGPGDVFGELALLSSEPRMATVAALEECEFVVVDRGLLVDTIAATSPDAILKLFAVLSNQIRAVNEREFQEVLSKRTLEAEMEAERQRSLTQMVAGVAHELNTPLGVVNTAASIVARELNSPAIVEAATSEEALDAIADIREALGLIQGNVQRAHQLVQDFKKVSVSQLTDIKEPMLISDAVQETVNLAQVHLKRSGLQIEVRDYIPAERKRWIGFRGYLSQVLLNLLSNIERYAYPPGAGGKAQIDLALGEPDKFVITVRDFGLGMAPEVVERVFEPFFTTGRATGGTGLGMAIVHNLVTTALKGSIDIRSKPGKGTTITVSIPRAIPD